MGLPLLEAASLNKWILCANEEYSLETLSGYKRVFFLDARRPDLWAGKCIQILRGEIEVQEVSDNFGSRSSETAMFDLISKIIQ